jgi:hypothetical protein
MREDRRSPKKKQAAKIRLNFNCRPTGLISQPARTVEDDDDSTTTTSVKARERIC